jgi:hypothetical protein
MDNHDIIPNRDVPCDGATTPSSDGVLKDDTALGNDTIPLGEETVSNNDITPYDAAPNQDDIVSDDTTINAETILNPDGIIKMEGVVNTDGILGNTILNSVVPLPLPEGSALKQRYLLKGLQGADNTERAYRADLDYYVNWCTSQELVALPATPAVVGEYVSALASRKRWATISRRLAAIRKWHELHGQESPLSDRWLKATLKGIQREHGTHA